MQGELKNEFQGQEVFPKSLFDAQLDFRLNPDKYPPLSAQIESSRNEILVYPNPFSDELSIQSEEVIDRIALIDMIGRSVRLSTTVTESGIVLKLQEGTASGLYLLSVETNGKLSEYRVRFK
jgi:hypothetical protein